MKCAEMMEKTKHFRSCSKKHHTFICQGRCVSCTAESISQANRAPDGNARNMGSKLRNISMSAHIHHALHTGTANITYQQYAHICFCILLYKQHVCNLGAMHAKAIASQLWFQICTIRGMCMSNSPMHMTQASVRHPKGRPET